MMNFSFFFSPVFFFYFFFIFKCVCVASTVGYYLQCIPSIVIVHFSGSCKCSFNLPHRHRRCNRQHRGPLLSFFFSFHSLSVTATKLTRPPTLNLRQTSKRHRVVGGGGVIDHHNMLQKCCLKVP